MRLETSSPTTGLLKLGAFRSGAAVLPDDGGVDGLAGGAVPHDHGFALVGDADGGQIAGARAGLGEDFDSATELGGEDLIGVVLDPAGLGVKLLEFVLGDGDDGAGLVEENGAGTGGSLIESEDVGHGCGSAFRRPVKHGGGMGGKAEVVNV